MFMGFFIFDILSYFILVFVMSYWYRHNGQLSIEQENYKIKLYMKDTKKVY